MIVINKDFPYVRYVRQKNEFEFFFAEATNEEKQLLKLTAPELAQEFNNAKAKGDSARCLLIEHYLALRLTKIQANATLIAAILSLLGILLGVLLGFALGPTHNCQ